jgi:NADPH:quinone reductase-like Zn-dependent oxidoreductase
MKAIQVNNFGEPEVMKLQEVKEPMPGEGEVVIDVRAYSQRLICY